MKKSDKLFVFLVTCLLCYTPTIIGIGGAFLSLEFAKTLSTVLVLLIILNRIYKMKLKVFNLWVYFLVLSIQLISIARDPYYFEPMQTMILFILPLLLVCIDFSELEAISIIKIFNRYMMFIFILVFLDLVTFGGIQAIIVKLLPDSMSLKTTIQVETLSGNLYRAHSLIGHSLYTATYFIFFFIINSLNIKYNLFHSIFVKYKWLMWIISIIGVVAANSKMGLLVFILLVIWHIKFISQKKVITLVLSVILLILIINTDFFRNNILQRFLVVLNSDDITNGRLSSITDFFKYKYYHLSIFGKGTGFNGIILNNYADINHDFETPFMIFLVDYGYITLLLLVILFLLIPLYRLRKELPLFISLLLFSVFVYSFNSIGIVGQYLESYIIFIYLIINFRKFREKVIKT
ncbi:hypothetical protein [Gottfriedia acidiceleris]|uniref:hypothetical protein n=1 Tax=Gottfriedia acidiceleris TaxID=371036 RepID=UPI00101CBAD7|nr:hypothetical protein [Gottfriedia acidiceleris]